MLEHSDGNVFLRVLESVIFVFKVTYFFGGRALDCGFFYICIFYVIFSLFEVVRAPPIYLLIVTRVGLKHQQKLNVDINDTNLDFFIECFGTFCKDN